MLLQLVQYIVTIVRRVKRLVLVYNNTLVVNSLSYLTIGVNLTAYLGPNLLMTIRSLIAI